MVNHMKPELNKRNTTVTVKRYWFALVVVVGLLIAAVIYIEHNDTNRFQQEERLTVLNKLSTVRARLEGVINGNLLLVTGLTAEFSLNPEITQEDFSRRARLILAENTQIRNIGAARDLVITHMYPMKGNEKALGLDYRKNEDQRDAALKAKEVGGIFVAGPVNLVQGGRGFVARTPVFEAPKDSTRDRGQFWGLVSTVIDEDRLYNAAGLSDPNLPIEIAIRGQDSSGSEGDVFFGRPGLFEGAQVLLDVSLVNGSWQLAGAPKGGWTQETPNAPIIRSVSFVILLLIIWVTFYRARQKREKALVEIAVRGSEEKLLWAESVAHLGHWRFSLDDGVLDLSPEVCRIFGYDPEKYRPTVEESIKCYHPDDQNEVTRLVGEAIETGQEFEFELRIVRPDGAVRTVFAKGECEIGDGGKTTGLFGIFQDITERKQVEETLRKQALVWEQMSEGVVALDIDGRILDMNPAAEGLFGYSTDEVRGKSGAIFHREEIPGTLVAQVSERVRRDGYWSGEVDIVRKDGSAGVVEATAMPLRDENGNYIGGIAVNRDITERKAMESQLLQAQKMETVGQLTGGVAHDFNNLLQIVQGNLEMAKDTIPEGSRTKELVNGALRAGHRGAKLTQQLLAFSRKQTLRPENLDARSLVGGMTALLARTLGEDISIETQFADGIANIIVDENGLTNALLNLALNARAAMPRGGTLTVAVDKRHFNADVAIENDVLPMGDYVEITVTDTGFGMSAETLAHAFEPFFTTKEVGEGSGLGLSLVYGFARQSGGNATIESEPSKGTTVRLMLPAAEGDAVSANHAQLDGKDVRHAIRVLLVEDDADVRGSTVMLLKALGCEVIEADNAAPVPGILEQDDRIDLLLSDVVLPGGKTGIELAQEAVRLRPGLKVILVSGYPEGTLEGAGLKDAGFPLLSKPFSKAALSEALASMRTW